MSFRATSLVFAALLGGCPPDVSEPEPPPGEACVSASDCARDDAPCGLVWACVAGVCEDQPSRTTPCDGGP